MLPTKIHRVKSLQRMSNSNNSTDVKHCTLSSDRVSCTLSKSARPKSRVEESTHDGNRICDTFDWELERFEGGWIKFLSCLSFTLENL